jgi:soluble cytochrome b562
MTSFLEKSNVQFNPYIPTLPLDVYYSAGVNKQQAYNQGVAKVNEYLQSISGIPVVRDVDKQYVTQKLTDITSRVNQVASADWSKQSMVSQVGAMASSIYNDKTIQNAVSGTQQYRKLLADVDQAKSSGKGYSTQNEWDALSSVQSWLSNPTPGVQYSGKSYSPYVDISKKINDYFKDKHPDWIVESNPMVKMDSGEPGISAYVMINNKKEYVDPVRLKGEMSAILEPQDYNQLSINGRYGGRGFTDPAQYISHLDQSRTELTKSYQAQIDNYKSIIEKSKGDRYVSQQLNGYIDSLKNQIETTDRAFEEHKQLIKDGNMEEVKSSLYTDKFLTGWANNLGYTKTETSYSESPVFKSMMDQKKMDMDHQKFLLDSLKTKAEIDKINAESRKLLKGKGKGEDEEERNFIPLALNNAQAHELVTNFASNTQAMQDSIADSKWKMLYDYMSRVNNFDENKLSTMFNTGRTSDGQMIIKPKKEREAALEMEYQDIKDKYDQNPSNVDQYIQTYFQDNYNRQLIANTRQAKYVDLNKKADKLFNLDADLAGKQSLYFHSPRYGEFIATPKDIMEFNEKLKGMITTIPSMGPLGTQSGEYLAPPSQSTFKTNKERALYEAYYKSRTSQDLNPAEQMVVDRIHEINRDVNIKRPSLMSDRSAYILKELEPYTRYQQNFIENIPTGKEELRKNAKDLAQSFYDNLKEGSGGTSGLNSKTLAKLLKDDNTTYSYQYNVDGSVAVRLSNAAISNNSVNVPIDAQAAASLQIGINDPVAQWRDLMGVNITPTGTRFTGKGYSDALSLNNTSLQKYSIKFNVIQSPQGQFTLDMYIFDRNQNRWLYKDSPFSNSGWNSMDEINTFLNSPQLEGALDQSLKPKDGTNPK